MPGPPSNKSLHILCTGGAGYIGSHTVIHLVRCGHRVSVLDNLSNSSQEVITRLKQICHADDSSIQFFSVDMTNKEKVLQLFLKEKFDAVIHYAGLKAVGESIAKPLEYYDTNINGTLNILQGILASGCKVLVFSSSATVYKPQTSLVDENCPLGASNPYGHSKLFIEQILKDTVAANPTLRVSILRYFNPVGAHDSGLIGESPDQPQNLLPYITQVAVGRKKELHVYGDDWETKDGTGVRDYIHVEDLAEGHIAALNKLLESATGCCLVHNLGTGRGVSVLELKNSFEQACGKLLPHVVDKRRPGDLGFVVANPSKAEKDLGWKAKRTVEEACSSSWKWQFQNPYGYASGNGSATEGLH